MEQQIKNILTVVANETLEKLAFLFAFPDDERRNDGPPPAVTGRVDFNGFFSGSLIMRVSNSVVPEIAVNMLGLDDDSEISVDAQHDAFKEIINVICGNLLPAIAGNQVEFSIRPPVILAEGRTPIELKADNRMCVVRLMLEDGFGDIYFFADDRHLEELILKENTQN
jgi:CheY-specific phosphatase CheX